MVHIVERYLPGLDRAELLRALERLQAAAAQLTREGVPIRYLGSTLVPEDEACFCHFDAPSAAVVVEANRRADVPFDRIVAALAIPRSTPQDNERACSNTRGGRRCDVERSWARSR